MSQGFRVEPDAVHSLADLVGRAGDASSRYAKFLSDPDLTTQPTQWNPLLPGPISGPTRSHNDNLQPLVDLVNSTKAATRKASELATAAEREFHDAATEYERTDRDQAAALDRTYTPQRSTPLRADQVRDPGAARDFKDWRDAGEDPRHPGSDYQGPPPADAKALLADEGWPVGLEQEVDNIIGLGGSLAVVNDFIVTLGGPNFGRELATALEIDWQTAHRQALLFKDTSGAFHTIGENIDHGRYGIQDVWDGNAASAAENWLATYARNCRSHSELLSEAYEKLLNGAQAAYHLYQSIRLILGELIDIVILILTRGGATVLAQFVRMGVREGITRLVDLLGKGSLLKKLMDGPNRAEIVQLIAQALGLAGTLSHVLNVLLGVIHAIAGLLEAKNSEVDGLRASWPQKPYEHP